MSRRYEYRCKYNHTTAVVRELSAAQQHVWLCPVCTSKGVSFVRTMEVD